MKYFDEMNSKYGFSDGEAIPDDAPESREVYCKVLNALLEKVGSKCRIVPFNRGGCHNWCLWLCISADAYNALTPEERLDGDNESFGDEVPTDEAWHFAVGVANRMQLDDRCIRVAVTIDEDELATALKEVELVELYAKKGEVNDTEN